MAEMWQDLLTMDPEVMIDPEVRPFEVMVDPEVMPGAGQTMDLGHIRRIRHVSQRDRRKQQDKGVGPIRNNNYLSLRVKLLKRQFGLPSEVLNLKNLSLTSTSTSTRSDSRNNNRKKVYDWAVGSEVSEEEWEVSQVLHQDTGNITRLGFADNNTLVSSSTDGTLTVFHLTSTKKVTIVNNNPILDLDLCPDLILTCHGDLKLWDIRTGEVVKTIEGESATFGRFVPCTKSVVFGTTSGQVKVMDLNTNQVLSSIQCDKPISVAIHPQGHLLWVGNGQGTIESFYFDSEQVLHKGVSITPNPNPVSSLEYTSGDLLVANYGDNDLRIFSVKIGAISPQTTVNSSLKGFGLRPDGLVVYAEDNSVLLMDPDSKEIKNRLKGHVKPVSSVGHCPDGLRMASGDQSGQVIVWKKKM